MKALSSWTNAVGLVLILGVVASVRPKQIPAPPDDGLLDDEETLLARLAGRSVAVMEPVVFDKAWWERAMSWGC